MRYIRTTAGMKRRQRKSRGASLIESSLVLVALLALVFGVFDFAYPVFVFGTLRHAVVQGTRFAVVGTAKQGMTHDESIKDVVKSYSLGLVEGQESKIKIRYFEPDGSGETSANDAGNVVTVSVEDYEVPRLAPLLWASDPLQIAVTAVDRMEPFPHTPPAR